MQDANDNIPNQLNKATNKPSIKWDYYLFQGIQKLTVKVGDAVQQLVTNLSATLKKVISYFGVVAQTVYLNSA